MINDGWYLDREKERICLVEKGRALAPDCGRWYTPDSENLESIDIQEYQNSIKTRMETLEKEAPQEYPNSTPLRKATLEREAEFIERMSKHTGEPQSLPKCIGVGGIPFRDPNQEARRYIGSNIEGLRKHISNGS